jgi:uncharacterized surface protein with fasciclin (FAS1) repeats
MRRVSLAHPCILPELAFHSGIVFLIRGKVIFSCNRGLDWRSPMQYDRRAVSLTMPVHFARGALGALSWTYPPDLVSALFKKVVFLLFLFCDFHHTRDKLSISQNSSVNAYQTISKHECQKATSIGSRSIHLSSESDRCPCVAELVAERSQQYVHGFLTNPTSTKLLPALLSTQPALVSTLAGASSITILAPSNEALGKFLNSSTGMAAASAPDVVAALLTYHVLNGTYPASAFTNMSMFIPTLLTNTSYANVTGGQRVEAVAMNNSVVFTSGLLSTSTVTTAVRSSLHSL